MNSTDFIRLSGYDPASYKEKKKGEIIYYGENNDFPEYLISLYYGSPTHGSVTKTKAQMIFGNGFTGGSNALIKIARLGIQDVAEKCALDFCIQGGFCFEVVYSLDRSSIAEVRHVEFERIRCEESDAKGVIHWYQYCEDWTDKKKVRDAVRIKGYDPAEKNLYPTQLVYVRPFTAGLNHYPKPDYLGAINSIELEKSIEVFLINHMKNGMTPTLWLHFLNGEPDDVEKAKIRREIEGQMSGSENAGVAVITYSDGVERKPEIDSIQVSDAPQQWAFIETHVRDKILIAHRVTTPVMFGIKEAGQLGATQELEMGAKLFEKNVIKPMRRHLIQAFQSVLYECGITDKVTIQSEELTVSEVKMSQEFTFEDEQEWIERLKDKGEPMGDEWEVYSEEDAGGYEGHQAALDRLNNQQKFFDSYANPQDKSEWGDAGLFKVRYKYIGGVRENSRDFCRVMMNFSNSGLFYRFEDIAQMSDNGVNGQFSPRGRSNYDIFLYKGGANCHHAWQRVIFFRKTEGGKFLPKSQTKSMENDQRVGNNPNVPQKGKESIKPIDTPTKGYLNRFSALLNKITNATTK